MTVEPEILLFQTTDPLKVRRRLLRFRQAFLELGRHCEFALVAYVPTARTEVRKIVLDGIEIDHYVFGPDAVDTLAYPYKGAARPFRLIPGNCDLLTLLFRKARPAYAQYWVIEDDVEYSGDPRSLFAGLAGRGGDLLAAHLADGYEGWTYASMLRSPCGDVTPSKSSLVFLTFFRINGRALDTIDRYYREGWDGHSENMWATILKHAGMRVVDIGGNGKYVAEQDRNLRYYGLPDDRFEKGGSFGTMNIRLRAGRRKDVLWHPVKPPAAWLRQTRKRWLSIACWYLKRLGRAARRAAADRSV
jgi:PAS domain-containing protein